MQYWSQNEVTNTFESRFRDNNRTIPAGQDLREHYHAVMQMAHRVVQNSRIGFAISRSLAASRWQTNAQRPMELPDSPDIQATGNGHAQAEKAATIRLHRTLGKSLPSLHTSMKTYRKIYNYVVCAVLPVPCRAVRSRAVLCCAEPCCVVLC